MGQRWDSTRFWTERSRRRTSTAWTRCSRARRRGRDEPEPMLQRGVAAAAGLTILAHPATALARELGGAAPPMRGRDHRFTRTHQARRRRKGQINTIALPPDWANYGEIIGDVQEEVRHQASRTTTPTARRRRRTRPSARSRATRAPRTSLDVSPAFAIAGANEGLYAKYFNTHFGSVPRAMKDGRGFWVGDYWGAISFGVNREHRRATRRSRGPTCSSPSTRTRSR